MTPSLRVRETLRRCLDLFEAFEVVPLAGGDEPRDAVVLTRDQRWEIDLLRVRLEGHLREATTAAPAVVGVPTDVDRG